jgi:hypothetical protein
MVENNFRVSSEPEKEKKQASNLMETGSVMHPSIERLLKIDIGKLKDQELLSLTGLVVDNLAMVGLETEFARALIKEIESDKQLNEVSRASLRALLESERNSGRLTYDPITTLAKEDPLRLGLVTAIDKWMEGHGGKFPPVCCLHFDIDGLHSLNVSFGKEKVNPGFRKLVEQIVKSVNEADLPEDCFVFGFRKKETGDEILIFFVGLSHLEVPSRLGVLADRDWFPEVEFEVAGNPVKISASVGRGCSGEVREEKPEDIDPIVHVLTRLDSLTEHRINAQRKSRGVAR